MAVVSINEVTVFLWTVARYGPLPPPPPHLFIFYFCRDFKDPARLLWLHGKKRMSGLTQVSKLQKICGSGAETTIVFSKPQLQQATASSSNETIKTDFLDRRGSPVY